MSLPPPAPSKRDRLVGLALAPLATAVALVLFPRLGMSENAAALVAFSAALLSAFGALIIAMPARLSVRGALLLAAAAVLLEVGVVCAKNRTFAAIAGNFALVSLAFAIGASIGRRVEHPGHLLPACAVAGALDLVSLLHPTGPNHAIVANESALRLFTIGFAVPGTTAITPCIGLGDLLFFALVLGAAAQHGLGIARAAFFGTMGAFAAGVLSALLDAPIPALVPMGASFVAGLPQARQLKKSDRTVTIVAIAIAAAIVLGEGALRLLSR